jgi:hypothetical protein
MPGPFTHIYTARRVAEQLGSDHMTEDFTRTQDEALLAVQKLDPQLLAGLDRKRCAAAMNAWPKFTAVGAIGPDLFFWMQDYNNKSIPCDEIMLAMNLLYYLDDQGRLDDPYSELLLILAEVSDTWASILRFLVKLNQIWQKFLKVWNATIGPILDAAGKVVDDLTGGLLTALGDALAELKNALLALVEEELLTEGDIFGWFALKLRGGLNEQSFLWSDMTHYRRTSVIPARLIFKARGLLSSSDALTQEHGQQLLAFALGWVCHVGTDVIGHSFVNEQAGGPFRTHWQRHHLVENHIDAWNYQCTGNGTLPPDPFIGFDPSYPSLADSALYFAVQIPQGIDTLAQADKQGDLRQPLPAGTDSASQQKRKELLDTDGELPQWLAETVVQVLIELYAKPSEGGDATLQATLGEGQVPHPLNLMGQDFQDALHSSTGLIGKWLNAFGIDNVGMALGDLRQIIAPDAPFPVPKGFPQPWEMQASYRFMLSWLKRQYVATLDMDRPEPPTIFTPPASDFDFGPPDFSGVHAGDNPAAQACSAALALLDWLFKTLEKAGQAAYDIAKSIASAATWPAREAIYALITLPLWEASENMRMVLVHLGYALPQSQQFYADGNLRRPNEIDEELITLGHSVDSAFQAALAAAADPLGNLDKDPALNNVGIRPLPGSPYPWLPVRTTKGKKPPGLLSRFSGNDEVEYQRPWAYPDRGNDANPASAGNYLETPLSTSGPYLTHTMPHELLTKVRPISNRARTLYEGAGCPQDTELVNLAFGLNNSPATLMARGFDGSNPLGDPVVFSGYLIGQIANNPGYLSSFNLDADRGYGYLCWDWLRGTASPDAVPTDGQGNPYPPPVVWPEGAPATAHAQSTEQWPRPDPAPVGNNLYTPAVQVVYPGRHCKYGDGKGEGSVGNPTGGLR